MRSIQNRRLEKKMLIRLTIALMSLFLSLACPLAVAGNFNGTKSLICSVKDGVEVYRNGRPQPFYPESVGLPEKFIIDFKNKLIRPTKDSVIQRRSRIKRMERIEEKTILQGVEDGVEGVDDGVGWSMAIYQKTGRFVITASGGDVGYIVFGSCRVSTP